MSTRNCCVLLAAALAIGTVFSTDSDAYSTSGSRWNRASVGYHINPANLDLPTTAVETAVRAGAGTWAIQSGATFGFSYSGLSSQTTATYDGVNLVVFRNASEGSTIATTYSWYNSSGMVDADIVFWDGAFRFFAGTTGCTTGFYIEDIAAHEFGHALGLGHSASPSATMYPSPSSCNTSNRTLDADDIAGVRALYPPAAILPPTALRIVR